MNEQVLYYTPAPSEADFLLLTAVMSMGIRLKKVEAAQLHEQVGALAGLPGFALRDIPANAAPADIPEKFMILQGFSEKRLDAFLAFLRENKMPPVLKAVLTETNAQWTMAALYKELRTEHDAIAGGNKN